MSWSVTFPVLPVAEFLGSGLDAVTLPESQATKEHLEQLEAAKRAARMMVADRGLGPLEYLKYISGSCGGHANADYGPRDGWSNSSFYVNLYHANPPAPKAPPTAEETASE